MHMQGALCSWACLFCQLPAAMFMSNYCEIGLKTVITSITTAKFQPARGFQNAC